jgi:hypothetical protein
VVELKVEVVLHTETEQEGWSKAGFLSQIGGGASDKNNSQKNVNHRWREGHLIKQ